MGRPIDHYALLGVPRSARHEAIRAAYVAQVKACYPDFAATPATLDHFLGLQQAYECLRSPEKRARYDREIAAAADRQLRRVERARRRMKRPARLAFPPQPAASPPHWRAAIAFAAGGSMILSACYLFLR